MYERSTRFYDRLYSWKDYRAEVERVRELLRTHQRSSGRRLLDVACGTGLHLAHLRETHDVEGVDANDEMLRIARERCPGVPFHRGDMRSFDLGSRFDAVTCLFSSIGYLRTTEDLASTFRTFARPDLKICRMNSNRFDGRVSVMDMHHLVGTPEGTEHFVERHELTSFTPDEIGDAIRSAGLEALYDPVGLMKRGLHLGLAPA
jgi:SAM-dependent methyltransferase